jgi:hypothetical protein
VTKTIEEKLLEELQDDIIESGGYFNYFEYDDWIITDDEATYEQKVKILREFLSTSPLVKHLDFSDHSDTRAHIDQEKAQTIVIALKNRSINVLTLSYITIDLEEIRIIAEALKTNKTLTSLDLSDNQIGDAGKQAIIMALGSSESCSNVNIISCDDEKSGR